MRLRVHQSDGSVSAEFSSGAFVASARASARVSAAAKNPSQPFCAGGQLQIRPGEGGGKACRWVNAEVWMVA